MPNSKTSSVGEVGRDALDANVGVLPVAVVVPKERVVAAVGVEEMEVVIPVTPAAVLLIIAPVDDAADFEVTTITVAEEEAEVAATALISEVDKAAELMADEVDVAPTLVDDEVEIPCKLLDTDADAALEEAELTGKDELALDIDVEMATVLIKDDELVMVLDIETAEVLLDALEVLLLELDGTVTVAEEMTVVGVVVDVAIGFVVVIKALEVLATLEALVLLLASSDCGAEPLQKSMNFTN